MKTPVVNVQLTDAEGNSVFNKDIATNKSVVPARGESLTNGPAENTLFIYTDRH